ncbi:hypothetical protein M427DRAFT_45007 [Gonapodya prolifera JEL478]|uniref:Uncharacterized protein n=1 Tax=Gonapodya prolifera (strain JEL478) TaxID=1344416 RepID=A0A139ACX3_GONPJ|nr:hypothetical protein M427DRAFT_45007 [Gonapodya prolifera JEL478]|eukprot:KXS14627.1 hypothetical protein M427DRAFT_45007 [Gonapodya prolifera JEL478]
MAVPRDDVGDSAMSTEADDPVTFGSPPSGASQMGSEKSIPITNKERGSHVGGAIGPHRANGTQRGDSLAGNAKGGSITGSTENGGGTLCSGLEGVSAQRDLEPSAANGNRGGLEATAIKLGMAQGGAGPAGDGAGNGTSSQVAGTPAAPDSLLAALESRLETIERSFARIAGLQNVADEPSKGMNDANTTSVSSHATNSIPAPASETVDGISLSKAIADVFHRSSQMRNTSVLHPTALRTPLPVTLTIPAPDPRDAELQRLREELSNAHRQLSQRTQNQGHQHTGSTSSSTHSTALVVAETLTESQRGAQLQLEIDLRRHRIDLADALDRCVTLEMTLASALDERATSEAQNEVLRGDLRDYNTLRLEHVHLLDRVAGLEEELRQGRAEKARQEMTIRRLSSTATANVKAPLTRQDQEKHDEAMVDSIFARGLHNLDAFAELVTSRPPTRPSTPPPPPNPIPSFQNLRSASTSAPSRQITQRLDVKATTSSKEREKEALARARRKEPVRRKSPSVSPEESATNSDSDATDSEANSDDESGSELSDETYSEPKKVIPGSGTRRSGRNPNAVPRKKEEDPVKRIAKAKDKEPPSRPPSTRGQPPKAGSAPALPVVDPHQQIRKRKNSLDQSSSLPSAKRVKEDESSVSPSAKPAPPAVSSIPGVSTSPNKLAPERTPQPGEKRKADSPPTTSSRPPNNSQFAQSLPSVELLNADITVPPPTIDDGEETLTGGIGPLIDNAAAAKIVNQYLEDANFTSYLTVATPVVAQKSYGTEKRFLVPPPKIHIGGPYWELQPDNPPPLTLSGRLVTYSAATNEVSDIAPTKKAKVEKDEDRIPSRIQCTDWVIADVHAPGKPEFEAIGVLKGLHFGHEQIGEICARMAIKTNTGRVLAMANSAPIRVISKPSKHAGSDVKNSVFPRTPVCLFNRTKSQTANTRYLTGSDDTEDFIAAADTWDKWLVLPAEWLNPPSGSPQFPPPPKGDMVADERLRSYSYTVPKGERIPLQYNTKVVLRHTDYRLTSVRFNLRIVEGKSFVQDRNWQGRRSQNGPPGSGGLPGSDSDVEEPEDGEKDERSLRPPRKAPSAVSKPAMGSRSSLEWVSELHRVAFEVDGRDGFFMTNTDQGIKIIQSKRVKSDLQYWDIGESAAWSITTVASLTYGFYLRKELLIADPPVNPFFPRPMFYKKLMLNGHLLTIHGENFNLHHSLRIYFGTTQATQAQIRSGNLIIARMPPQVLIKRENRKGQEVDDHMEVVIVRGDGVVFPTGVSV